jgi:alkanesulfonate monooxygenase SsuD/methylene tetrahydromethanopterin reductase-like flavin-dependent oxidoreductase (luciferase family)
MDDQSAGRLAVGVGYGWNVEEMRDHGVDPETRRARAREHVLAMRRLWEDERASYEGEYVQLSPSWAWPKPRQRPLPVLIGGGATAAVFRQVVELAQGWIPLGSRGLQHALPRLRAVAADAGRDPAGLEVVPFLGRQVEPSQLEVLERLGVSEVAIDIRADDAPTVRNALDRIAGLVATLRG